MFKICPVGVKGFWCGDYHSDGWWGTDIEYMKKFNTIENAQEFIKRSKWAYDVEIKEV